MLKRELRIKEAEVREQQIREGWCPNHECEMKCCYVGGTDEFVHGWNCKHKETWGLTSDSYEVSEVQYECASGCKFSIIGLAGGDSVVTEMGK